MTGLWVVVGLVLQQLWLLRDHHLRLDLHPDDELAYLGAGLEFARGDLGALDWAYSPLTSLLYALLAHVPHGGLALPDLTYVGLALGSVLAVFWAFRDRHGDIAAGCAAAFWGQLPLCLHYVHGLSHVQLPSVYVLGVSLAVLALGCLLRRRLGAALVFMGLAACNRPEALAWLGLFCGAAWICWWRGRLGTEPRDSRVARILGVGTAAALVLGLVLLFSGEGGRRSFFAFSQHYAQAKARDDRERLHSFVIHEEITRRDFPTAQTLPQLLAENPAAFAGHVLHNLQLGLSPTRIAYLMPIGHLWSWSPVFLLLLWGLLRRSQPAGEPAGEPGGATPALLPRSFALASLVVIASAASLSMRPDHLSPLIIWPLWGLAAGLRRGLGALGTRSWLLPVFGGLLLLQLAAALVPPRLPAARLPLRTLRALAQEQGLPTGAQLVGPYGADLRILLERRPASGRRYWCGQRAPEAAGFELLATRNGVGIWRGPD